MTDTFRDQGHHDARAWMNRALLAESRLAVLRTAYEPPRNGPYQPTDASGDAETPLPSTEAEQE